MSGAEQELIPPAYFVSGVVMIVGFLALWANPSRRINRRFFSASIHVAAWLVCVTLAQTAEPVLGLLWLRVSSAVGALIPFHLWVLKETIIRPRGGIIGSTWSMVGWVSTSLMLAALPLTFWFIPTHSTPENPVYGPGYYAFVGGVTLSFAALCREALVKLKDITGVARIELQIALLGGSAAAGVILALMALRTFLTVPSFVQPLVIATFYAFTTVTITTHRLFDAKHLLTLLLQRVLLLALVSSAAFGLWTQSSRLISDLPAFVIVTAFIVWSSNWLTARLDKLLLRFPKAIQARQAAFGAAQSEVRTEELRAGFRNVLNGWGQTEKSVLLIETEGAFKGGDLTLEADELVLAAIRDVQWATPERLDRERETPERKRLAAFLRENNLGVLVWEKGPTMQLVVGVGVRPSRRPFTFPEVNQLRELASIFESALSRTELLAKAQRAEQLATVGLLGASVAHEIRNPLVSIKTFAQLLPKHYDDPNFRERFSRLIGEEVSRIDRLTEQLLDLAAPRNFQRSAISLHEIAQSSVDLVTGRVSARNVQLNTRFLARPDTVWSDPNGLKQVIINLCFNAVQAQEVKHEDSFIVVNLDTRSTDQGIELVVADNGPGIPPEARDHLFEPFHSTKSNGFGLGLTVCCDILASLDSTITLDPYEAGRGAVFRVTLPCPPPSS